MIFVKTIDLWCKSTVRAIQSGQLKLQCGQWVRCGNDKQLSRYISYDKNSGVFNVVHGGSNKEVNHRFFSRVNINKGVRERC
jgi:hypothetical protein